MPFVLDASVALDWVFESEWQPTATTAFRRLREDEARVPAIWWFEMRNALVMAERRGRITEAVTAEFLRGLDRLRIVVDDEPNEQTVLGLARRHRLSVYDAAYLDLARRTGSPLATLDAKLARAARAEKVRLL